MNASVLKMLRSKLTRLKLRAFESARPWKHQGEFLTFREHGFVSATSPIALLTRHNYETLLIREMMTDGAPWKKSLEIGCGYGRLSPHLALLSEEHVAVDMNSDILAEAGRSYPALRFEQANVVDLPFPDGSFDLITAWTVLQHIRPTHIDAALKEILRVATPGATLLLCEQTRNPEAPERWDTHTWHRTVEFYESRLAPFVCQSRDSFEVLNAIEGSKVPGELMIFRRL